MSDKPKYYPLGSPTFNPDAEEHAEAMEDLDLTCFVCDGNGCRGNEIGSVECHMCSGTGEITEELAKEIKEIKGDG